MINRELEAREAANAQIAEDFRRKQEAQIRNLAGVYESLFRGGTKSVWRDFKEIGIRVIAETLARFTIAQAAGQGGGIGGFFGTALTSVLGFGLGGSAGGGDLGAGVGFASGGSMLIGGRGGTDTNILSVNGRQVANVSRGETLSVGSRVLAGKSAAPTVINAPQFNMAGAIVTRELYADMERISNESAARAGKAAYTQSMRDAPGAVRRAQRFRTT